MGLNRYYQTGIHIGGEAPGEWSISQYEAFADALWKGARDQVSYAVIEIARNREKFIVSPYQSKEAAADRYGRSTEAPGWAVYVALYSRSVLPGEIERIDEAFFRPTDIIRTERVPFPVKAGLGALGLFGLLALVAKH